MALPRSKPQAAASPPADRWEQMYDPLHPMHQDLLRRISTEHSIEAAAAAPGGWSGPARFAAVFYLGAASWGAVGLFAFVVSRVI